MIKSKDDSYKLVLQKIDLITTISIDIACKVYEKLDGINLMIEQCINKLQKIISAKTITIKDCILIAQEIDQIIMLLGQLTQEVEHEQIQSIKNILNDIGVLKEKVWSLLEALDEFCKSEFNFLIW